MVTGMYVKRSEENPEPLLYQKTNDGRYKVLDNYRVGEILPIDASGMGGCLMHRSVLEDIERDYRVLMRPLGALTTVHKDDIVGSILDDDNADTDNKVIDGVLHTRLRMPLPDTIFPFFMLGDGRSEDYGFFERAAKVGHTLYADTSVEIGHITDKVMKPSDWRKKKRGK